IRVSVVATGIDSIQQTNTAAAPTLASVVEAAQVRPASWCPAPRPALAAVAAPPLADLVEIATCLEARAFQDEVQGDELLLTADRVLILSPPEGAAEF